MKVLVWVCHASVLLYCTNANLNNEANEIHGHRHNDKRKEDNLSKGKEENWNLNEKITAQAREKIKPDFKGFRNTFTTFDSQEMRLAHEKKKREEQEKRDLIEEKYKKHKQDVLESLDKKIALLKKEMEEKEKLKRTFTTSKRWKDATTVHPLFRTIKTLKPSTTENSAQVFTASSGLLHELQARRKQFTGDSAHYDRLYEEEYKDVTIPPSQSLSSDYSEWEKWYEDEMKRPKNETTPHYTWWTYDPNETCEFYNGMPINYNRALYSLKMSSILPPNISAEIDAHYNQKSVISFEYAEKIKREQDEWARTLTEEYNSDAGPIPERRELRQPFEIFYNRYLDKEMEMQIKLEKDVKNYFITPAMKGLYHFKKWMNPKYSTTTRRIAMTWPSHSMEDQEMIDLYKKYLREEKNLTIRDSAGKSVFENYRFTDISNYYDESRGDLPHRTLNPY